MLLTLHGPQFSAPSEKLKAFNYSLIASHKGKSDCGVAISITTSDDIVARLGVTEMTEQCTLTEALQQTIDVRFLGKSALIGPF